MSVLQHYAKLAKVSLAVNKIPDHDKLDRIVAEARRQAAERGQSYREQALKLYPWICGRCARDFTRDNLQQLTVHHRDHNHSHNPADGSNWELLCIYCHENEHAKQLDAVGRSISSSNGGVGTGATFQPFAELKSLLGKKS